MTTTTTSMSDDDNAADDNYVYNNQPINKVDEDDTMAMTRMSKMMRTK